MERTFIMIKPDGFTRGLVGEIVARFERRGLTLRGMKAMRIPRELAERHYGEHREMPFFDQLCDFVASGPVVAMVWEGHEAIGVARAMMGATDPVKATAGTIRGDFATVMAENVVHGSDGAESAAREIALFFDDDELV